MDLREKLSRAARSPIRTETRQRKPEPRSPDSRHRMPEARATDTRQRMPDPRATDTRHRVPEATGIMRRVPPTRNADDMVQMESLRKPYSGWSLDGLRSRSPDRLLGSSRGLSPPRSMEVRRSVRDISSATHVDGSRPSHYIPKDIFDPAGPTSFLSKASVPLESPAVRLPPQSVPGVTQKVSYMVC